jgi:AraC-like DNA-binding protein
MLYLIIIQSILSALVFVFLKAKHPSNYIIALWFCINALNFMGQILPGSLNDYIGIGFLPFIFLIGPIFFFYIASFVKIDFRFKWLDILHSVPFLTFGLSRFFIYKESLAPSFYFGGHMSMKFLSIYILISISITAYLIAIYVMLVKHRRNIKNYFSSTPNEIKLDWVFVIMTLISLSYIFLFYVPLLDVFSLSIEKKTFWFVQFNGGLLAFILLVFGLLQPIIYNNSPVNTEERKNTEFNKLVKTGLTEGELKTMANEITNYLDKKKPYLDPEYNLEMMARDLNITRQNISVTINDTIGKNFYQLINEYRVDEFKQLVLDSKNNNITLLGLAYDAGFNSKSSFNRIFKEITGSTPSSYKNEFNG